MLRDKLCENVARITWPQGLQYFSVSEMKQLTLNSNLGIMTLTTPEQRKNNIISIQLLDGLGNKQYIPSWKQRLLKDAV